MAFVLLRWVYARLSLVGLAQTMAEEGEEVRTASIFIAGLGFAIVGVSRFNTSPLASLLHYVMAAPCLCYLPYWYVNTLIKKRNRRTGVKEDKTSAFDTA